MSYKKRTNFLDTEEAQVVKIELQEMLKNPKYATKDSYSADVVKYPSHSVGFVDKHMDYLQKHPNVNADYYLANLKLISKIR